MQKILSIIVLLLCSCSAYSQEDIFDEKLAKSLGADEYGMKKYVFCLLKTGTNTSASKEESAKAFAGHMANINRLAKEGKLVVAGPFMNNDKNYRGIFVFNVDTIEAAKALVDSDPAVQANLLEADLTVWYATAALMETLKVHDKIAKTKF
jgi:uncharacterized protein YciI